MSVGRLSWLELSVQSPSSIELGPLLVEGLLVIGGRAIVEADGWYVTYVEFPEDVDVFVQRATETLQAISGTEVPEIRTRRLAHEDWAETWKRGLAARLITERILVRPSWITAPTNTAQVDIVIDPGMAFGTAEHGTTRGCLRLLDKVVQSGDRVLDVGAGSGILSIAAALLGAEEVVAIEADLFGFEALCQNVERNSVTNRVQCFELDVDAKGIRNFGPVSGVVANIEMQTLARLMPGLSGARENGGWLILSGIQRKEWPDMQGITERFGLNSIEVDADGEWRSGLFRTKGEWEPKVKVPLLT